MQKKQTRKQLVTKLDTVFSQYIRRKDAVNDIATCVTCGKKDNWKKLQCGHFMSRRHYSTRWDVNNVGVQCYGCNVMKQGEQFRFSQYLTNIDNNLAQDLLIKSNKTVKFADVDLIDMIDKYSILLESL